MLNSRIIYNSAQSIPSCRKISQVLKFHLLVIVRHVGNCALLGHYAVSLTRNSTSRWKLCSSGSLRQSVVVISCRHFGTTYRSHLHVRTEDLADSCEVGTDRLSPETSVRNYHYSLRNNPKGRSSHPCQGGSLKSRTVCNAVYSAWVWNLVYQHMRGFWRMKHWVLYLNTRGSNWKMGKLYNEERSELWRKYWCRQMYTDICNWKPTKMPTAFKCSVSRKHCARNTRIIAALFMRT